MPDQLIFELPVKEDSGRNAFFVSDANRNSVAVLENSATWPQKKMMPIKPF